METVLISEYSEVERLLEAISLFSHRKNVFISGAASEFGEFGQEKMNQLSEAIGQKLIEQGYNLVSGFGSGIAEKCIIGAFRAIYQTPKGDDKDRTIIRPFPRVGTTGVSQENLSTRHREDLILRSGAAIFWLETALL